MIQAAFDALSLICLIFKDTMESISFDHINGLTTRSLAALCSLISLSSLDHRWSVQLLTLCISSLPVCQLLFTSQLLLDLLELLLSWSSQYGLVHTRMSIPLGSAHNSLL